MRVISSRPLNPVETQVGHDDVGTETARKLVPLGVDADCSTSRAVLASALDDGQLAPGEPKRLFALFPQDRHLNRVCK